VSKCVFKPFDFKKASVLESIGMLYLDILISCKEGKEKG
jgi:hypothetical protein